MTGWRSLEDLEGCDEEAVDVTTFECDLLLRGDFKVPHNGRIIVVT